MEESLENSNLIKDIRASMNVAIRNQGASIKALEIQIGQISKVLQERGSGNLPSSIETNPRDHVKSISTTVDTDTTSIRRIRPGRYAISGPQNSKLFFVPRQATVPFPSRLYNDCYDEEEGSCGLKNFDAYSIGTSLLDDALPPKEKDPGSFTLPCYINNFCFNKSLAELGASVSVMPFSTYTNLGLGELAPTKLIVELADKTVKRAKGIAERGGFSGFGGGGGIGSSTPAKVRGGGGGWGGGIDDPERDLEVPGGDKGEVERGGGGTSGLRVAARREEWVGNGP
ncbi:hypothetical protein Tco_0237448 [Tanacetum coccineum]